jgi:predicted ATPase
MIGRERELELLLEGLDALPSGRGRLFLLTGEPGIGKTRRADELSKRATERAAHCVWGAAWDGGEAPAYWPWIQALRALRVHFGQPDARA